MPITGRLYPKTLAADAPERVQPVRSRKGSPPADAQHPLTLAELHDPTDNTVWRLAWARTKIGPPGRRLAQPRPDDSEWLNCKLYAVERALHKANFWTSWHPEEKRFTARGDTKSLQRDRPKLLEMLAGTTLKLAEFLQYSALDAVPLLVARYDASGNLTVAPDAICDAFMLGKRVMATADNTARIKYLTGILGKERGYKFAVDEPHGLGIRYVYST